MRLLSVLAFALLVSAGLSAPALADGSEGMCPRASMAASSDKSTGSVAEMPAAQSVAPTTQTVTTTTTPTGG